MELAVIFAYYKENAGDQGQNKFYFIKNGSRSPAVAFLKLYFPNLTIIQ